MKLALLPLLAFLGAPLVQAQSKNSDPFGDDFSAGDRKDDFERIRKVAEKIFGPMSSTLSVQYLKNGTQQATVHFFTEATKVEEMQETLLRTAAAIYRTKAPLSELILIAKSKKDFTAPKDDPTDLVRVRLNMKAAEKASWQNRKPENFAKLFSVIWIQADYLAKAPAVWPPVEGEAKP